MIVKFKNNNNQIDLASFIELTINFSHHKMGEILMTKLFLSKSSSLKDSRIYNRTNKIRICWIALYYILKINKLAKTDLLRIYQILMRMNNNLKELNLKQFTILLINNKKSKVKGNKQGKNFNNKKSTKTNNNNNKFKFVTIQNPNHQVIMKSHRHRLISL